MSLKTSVRWTLILFLFFEGVHGANILGIFMGLGRNHYVLGKLFMKNLVEAGHNCVLISRYCDEINNELHYKEIIVRDDEHSDTLFEAIKETNRNPFYAIHRLHENSKRIIPKVFEESKVKSISNETFDVVVIEEGFVDALKVFAWHFKAHLIIFHPHTANFWVNNYMGNPCLPAYITEYPASFGIFKNYFERVLNVILYVYEMFYKEFVYLKEQNEIMKIYFKDSPDLSQLIYNTSLAFLNSDVSIHQSVPTLPNMIDIGGYHIDVFKSLPSQIINFHKTSSKGVVYIDMDFLTSSYMPESTYNWIFTILSEFDYDFLWVWDERNVPNQPKNLMFIQNPLPLGDVLAHQNTKLFIHLGNSKDIIESVYYGVPQLLMPVLDNQLYDTAQAEYHGYGKILPFSTLIEDNFRSALHELLNNTKFRDESLRRSKILKEKPITAKTSVKFWVDNVLKTKGASYMRSASLDYSWYQLFMLDILGLFVGVLLFVTVLLKTLIMKILRKCCMSEKSKHESKSYNSLSSIAG